MEDSRDVSTPVQMFQNGPLETCVPKAEPGDLIYYIEKLSVLVGKHGNSVSATGWIVGFQCAECGSILVSYKNLKLHEAECGHTGTSPSEALQPLAFNQIGANLTLAVESSEVQQDLGSYSNNETHYATDQQDRDPNKSLENNFENENLLDQSTEEDYLLMKKINDRTCPFCQKWFPTPFEVRRHLDSHRKGKCYSCPYCSKCFQWKDSVLKHQKKCEFKSSASVEKVVAQTPVKTGKELSSLAYSIPQEYPTEIRIISVKEEDLSADETNKNDMVDCSDEFLTANQDKPDYPVEGGQAQTDVTIHNKLFQVHVLDDGEMQVKLETEEQLEEHKSKVEYQSSQQTENQPHHNQEVVENPPGSQELEFKQGTQQMVCNKIKPTHEEDRSDPKYFPEKRTEEDCLAMKKHINDIECSYCHKRFSKRYKLNRHLTCHKNISHSCAYCKKQFKWKDTLVKHHKKCEAYLRGDGKVEKDGTQTPEKDLVQRSKKTAGQQSPVNSVVKASGKNVVPASEMDMVKDPENMLQSPEKHVAEIEDFSLVKQNINSLTCSICYKQFSWPYELKRHSAKHTKEKSHSCAYCEKLFSWRDSLMKHQKRCGANAQRDVKVGKNVTLAPQTDVADLEKNTETNVSPVKRNMKCLTCSFCHKQFDSRNELKTHLDLHKDCKSAYSDKQTKWRNAPKHKGQCEKKLQKNVQVEKGMTRTRTKISAKTKGLIKVQCSACKKQLSMADEISKHTCDGDKSNAKAQYVCLICTNVYTAKTNLSSHMKIHTNDVYTCEKCGRVFPYHGSYQTHIKFCYLPKEEQYRFKCAECPKVYKYHSSLVDHERIHRGELLYKCEVCGKHFLNNNNRRQHMKTIHSDEKPFMCSICGKFFSQQSALNLHVKFHIGKRDYTCDVCGKAFIRGVHLTSHKKIVHSLERNFQCQQCPKAFKCMAELRKHEFYHTGIRPYKCKLCPMAFKTGYSLRYHEGTHTGLKRFECSVCHQKFSIRANMRKHEQKHFANSGEEPTKRFKE